MIKRLNRFSFTDEPSETSKAICSSCWDRGMTVKTVQYIMANGRPDSKFRQCPECNDVIPVRLTRNLSETLPLGSTIGIGEVKFEVANPSRSRSRRNRTEADFDIPKFGNFEDTDLIEMVAAGGIILSIIDDYIETTEE